MKNVSRSKKSGAVKSLSHGRCWQVATATSMAFCVSGWNGDKKINIGG